MRTSVRVLKAFSTVSGLTTNIDTTHLKRCIELARQAGRSEEVPVGAIIVCPSGIVLAEAMNASILDMNASSHAELIAMGRARKELNASRLDGCTMYVSLEPCIMCFGAVLLHKIRRVVYCLPSPKFGAKSLGVVEVTRGRANHETEFCIAEGSLGVESAEILRNFFEKKRGIQSFGIVNPGTNPLP